MGESVTIRLEVYLPFRGRRLWRGEEAVPPGTTVDALLEGLHVQEPELAVVVNGRRAASSTVLQGGDEVAILRQVEGGVNG